MKNNILVIIPARGGSKGIPRKNLRTLVGKPLIYYSIKMAQASSYVPDVYVSTDDGEIAAISEKLGAKVLLRDAVYARDDTTLDPVVLEAHQQAVNREAKCYDLIITIQPTSPLLRVSSLDAAIDRIIKNPEIDTVISAKEDTHLSWRREGERFVPNYLKRVNRQYLEPVFRETGGFLIARNSNFLKSTRVGTSVELYLLHGGEEIDIDTYEDWSLCEYYLRRKHILFVVSGNNKIGLGHVYNTLLLANDILNHRIEFIVDKDSQLAYEVIMSKNYPVRMQTEIDIVDDIRTSAPDVVINDRLDSSEEYITTLKRDGIKVINFEDIGSGARHADLVINAIYPEKEILPRHYFGHEYVILRDEFFLTLPREPEEKVRRVLLTFGGVDPNNFTRKVTGSIYQYCQDADIEIVIVAGFGYQKYETLSSFEGIKIIRNSPSIAEQMNMADIIFTSAGRTTYEVASLHVPTIVLAQNTREMTHFFASAEFGFLNLGLGAVLTKQEILDAFIGLVENYPARQYMSGLMAKSDLIGGRKRVVDLINDIVEQV